MTPTSSPRLRSARQGEWKTFDLKISRNAGLLLALTDDISYDIMNIIYTPRLPWWERGIVMGKINLDIGQHLVDFHGEDPQEVAKKDRRTLEMYHFIQHDRMGFGWSINEKTRLHVH